MHQVLIKVDRSTRLLYPDSVKKIVYPELESVGPAEYDLVKVQLHLHKKQKGEGWVSGHTLYRHLKRGDKLKDCLGFHDALEIQKANVEVFQKLFGDKVLFCWRSIVREYSGALAVPRVFADGLRIVVDWDWIDLGWNDRFPTACFPS